MGCVPFLLKASICDVLAATILDVRIVWQISSLPQCSVCDTEPFCDLEAFECPNANLSWEKRSAAVIQLKESRASLNDT
jgi:hypothetical protein